MARRSDHSREELHELALEAAVQIVRDEGISHLSARKVARRMGYTVGTVYQVFRNMDDLVHQMNARTLDALYEACNQVPRNAPIGDRLLGFAGAFIGFARETRADWEAVMSYRYGPDHQMSPEYEARIDRILGLLIDATDDLYPDADKDRQIREVRVLWASVFGIFSLDAANRLGKGQSLEVMTKSLVELYLAAKDATYREARRARDRDPC